MTTIHKILAAALLVQGALAAVTWMPEGDEAGEARVLVDVEADAITSVTVTGRFDGTGEPPEPVELVRGDDGWVLASSFDYPAKDDALTDVLTQLAGLEVRGAVATREASQKALEVAPDAYTRKVELAWEGGATTLFLGAAQGRSAHVRVDGTSEVYRVSGLNAWSVPDQPSRYFDRALLDVSVDDVSSLTVARPGEEALVLTREGEGWTSPALAEGQALDADAVRGLVRQAVSVRMTEPVAAEATPEMGLASGVTVSWTRTEGESTVSEGYRLGAKVASDVYAQVDGRPHVVTVRESTVDDVLGKPLADLLDTTVDLDAALDAAP